MVVVVGHVTVLCITHYPFGQKWMSECPYCIHKVIHKGEQKYKDPRNPIKEWLGIGHLRYLLCRLQFKDL